MVNLFFDLRIAMLIEFNTVLKSCRFNEWNLFGSCLSNILYSLFENLIKYFDFIICCSADYSLAFAWMNYKILIFL